MNRRRALFLPLLLALAALAALPAAAQTLPPDPPVRYDADVLPPAFHRARRALVQQALPADAVAVFFSAPERNRENDVDFEYRQDSNLYYLTGTHEPGSVLLLAPGGLDVDGRRVTEVLLVPPRNAFSEVWVGRRYGAERAREELGIEAAVSNERFEEILGAALQAGRRAYHLPLPQGVVEGTELGKQLAFFRDAVEVLPVQGNYMVQAMTNAMLNLRDATAFAELQPVVRNRVAPSAFEGSPLKPAYEAFLAASSFEAWQQWRQDHLDARYADGTTLRQVLGALRVVKTPEEVALLQRAIDITASAHREAMRSIEPGMKEYEIEALVEYVFRRNGAQDPGFPSIVGSGENSVILHYNTNRRLMEAGDVVVIDIGAEYHGYTADVTRTLPVSGTFSPAQKTIYELVLAAQEAGIAAARAGNSFGAPGQAASRVIAEGLRSLDLIQRDEDVRNFFMHGTSHYLGLYVHDVSSGAELKPGAVITVEPGIYIRPSPNVDPKWWNIGVRIEDDVLVTDGDPVVMSAGAPRTVAAIEALMRERGLGNIPYDAPAPAGSH